MRQILPILFLKFCVFRLCCCDNICFGERLTLYLVQTEDEIHIKLNQLFKSKIVHHTKSKFTIRIQKVSNSSLTDVLKQLQPLLVDTSTFVVHLYVKDFYHHNYNDILNNNFTFAGNVGEEKEFPVCRSVNKTDHAVSCQESTEIQRNVKLVSKNIFLNNFTKLIDFINAFDENANRIDVEKFFCTPLIVGVCGDVPDEGLVETYSKLEMPSGVKLKFERECEQIDTSGMLALLTPKPFEPAETFVPTTIFYDEQLTSPETTDMFPNSFSPVKSTENLMFAFLKFMQENKWNRVAIISDDTTMSKEFERELTLLLENANIIFTSEICDVSNCNFSKILRRLIMAEARVVIANIGEDYVTSLAKEPSRMRTQAKGFIWIFRSQQVAQNVVTWKVGEVFSITLGPMIPRISLAMLCRSEPCNILAPLEALKRFLDRNYHNISLKRLTNVNYQRILSETIKSFFDDDGNTKAYVDRYKDNSSFVSRTQVAEMTISAINTVSYNKLVNLPLREELTDCTFKSDVYFNPCNDIEVIFIMLVVAVFALTLMGIVYFFQMSEGSYSRMHC